jgi:hypothetical protein
VGTQTEDIEGEETKMTTEERTTSTTPQQLKDQLIQQTGNNTNTAETITSLLQEFLKKLLGSLCETLSLNIHKESVPNRKKLIQSCFKHHFATMDTAFFDNDEGITNLPVSLHNEHPSTLDVLSQDTNDSTTKAIKHNRKSHKKKNSQ